MESGIGSTDFSITCQSRITENFSQRSGSTWEKGTGSTDFSHNLQNKMVGCLYLLLLLERHRLCSVCISEITIVN